MKLSEISSINLAIIGGGINGAGLAALAAHAGLSVVLFEKGDFASGASSKSTKLVHGGIRYLEQGRLPLVFEALHERQRLIQMAPHLVHPISFLLPSYNGDRIPPWKLKLGLWLYDLLAGNKNIAKHRWFSPNEVLEITPGLNSIGLRGCGQYYDAQVNDARLVLENILAAEEAQAHCFNYCEITQIDRANDKIRVFYHDERSNEAGVVTTDCLINSSGPWIDQIENRISNDSLQMLRPTRGTHIVVPEILSSHAVLITTKIDNRVIFVIPWRGNSLIGTTDLDDPGDPNKVQPTEEEILYLLKEAARIFPNCRLDRTHVISAFAGLRPLAWSEGGHASEVSREDKILTKGNILTIVGGKLTTYHSMALKALNKIKKILNKTTIKQKIFHLPGTPQEPWDLFLKNEIPKWLSGNKLNESQALHLAQVYGKKGNEILALLHEHPVLCERLHPERPEILAQVAYAVIKEKALHLEDVMLRRLEIGYSKERWGEASEKTSRLMGELLNWDEKTRQRELKRYGQQLYPIH